MGDIRVFGLDDWVLLTEYKHNASIRSIHPDTTGTRIIIIDAKMEGFLYTPVSKSIRILQVKL